MFNSIIFIFFVGAVNGLTEIADFFSQIPNIVKNGKGELCNNQSKMYQDSLKNHTLWAYQMFDSSAKSSMGILQGNSMELGNYEECLYVRGPFPTQHCVVTVNIYVPVVNVTPSLHENPYSPVFSKFQKPYSGRSKTLIGICLPASCSVRDIETSLTEYFQTTETSLKNESVKYNVSLMEDYMCTNVLHPNEFGVLQIMFCVLLAWLVVLVSVVTILDYKTEDEKEDFHGCLMIKQILFSFSARRTWKILFGGGKNQDELGIFHGVKTICQLFIVFGHLGYMAYMISWIELETLEKFKKYHIINIYSQLTLLLDVFFLMSGLLLSYGTLKKMTNRNINPIVLILFRYCRLTPINAFITFYFVAMLGFSGSGPAWNLITKPTIDNCLNNWWTNIFYVNNLVVGLDDWCNRVSWYLSADFQLFIMGAVVMYIIGRNQRAGYGILISLLVLSILPPFLLTFAYNFTMIAINNTDIENYTNLYYLKPYTYATTYIIGLIGGIIYHRFTVQKVKISKKQSKWIFGVSILFMVASYGYPILVDSDEENYIFEHALYNAVYRQLWTIGLLGTFIVGSFRPNSYLGSFLSSRIWIPFSKLSYGLYLVHWVVLIINFASSTDVLRPTVFNTMSLFTSITIISFAAAFTLYFLVEMPLIKVFTILLIPKNMDKKEVKVNSYNL